MLIHCAPANRLFREIRRCLSSQNEAWPNIPRRGKCFVHSNGLAIGHWVPSGRWDSSGIFHTPSIRFYFMNWSEEIEKVEFTLNDGGGTFRVARQAGRGKKGEGRPCSTPSNGAGSNRNNKRESAQEFHQCLAEEKWEREPNKTKRTRGRILSSLLLLFVIILGRRRRRRRRRRWRRWKSHPPVVTSGFVEEKERRRLCSICCWWISWNGQRVTSQGRRGRLTASALTIDYLWPFRHGAIRCACCCSAAARYRSSRGPFALSIDS